jgi:hypothetical protein
LHKLYAMMIWYADVQLLMQKVIIYQTYSHKVVESNFRHGKLHGSLITKT